MVLLNPYPVPACPRRVRAGVSPLASGHPTPYLDLLLKEVDLMLLLDELLLLLGDLAAGESGGHGR